MSRNILVTLLIIVFATVLINNAWICVDAFIGMRVVDNFVKGYGLRYNIIERVNPCTSILWVFVMSSVYYFTHEGFYTILFLQIILSVLALIIYSKINPQAAYIGVTVLILSKAFVDYSTSGLENPLGSLLLAIFFYIYFKKPDKIFLLSLTSSLQRKQYK